MIYYNLILILLSTLTGICDCWSSYNGEVLITIDSSHSQNNAVMACAALGGYLVEPVTPTIEEGVIQAAQSSYPAVTFWSGVVKNPSDPQDLLIKGYHLSADLLTWKIDSSVTDTGECIAMDVWSYGIRFFPADCANAYRYICQQPSATNYTEVSLDINGLPAFHEIVGPLSEPSCHLYCRGIPECIAFEHDIGTNECRLLNVTGVSLLNTTNPVVVCTIENITVCDPLNATYSYSDCIDNNGTDIQVCVTVPATTYTYKEVKGSCDNFMTPLSGSLYGSAMTFTCDAFDVVEIIENVTCGDDRRWSRFPKCALKTGKCPTGYEHFLGICYYIGPTKEVWNDVLDLCSAVGGYPLHIDSNTEIEFLEKFLQYTAFTDLWTGGTYRHNNGTNPSLYYWIHSYEKVSYKRWLNDTKPVPSISECISLTKGGSSLYYTTDSCFTKKNYMCTVGSSNIQSDYCDSDAWCKGNSKCVKRYNGNNQCYCYTVFNNRVGGAGDENTYCDREILINSGVSYWKVETRVQWQYAVAACKDYGGSLYTPLDTAEEALAQSLFSVPGYGGKYWTSLYTSSGELLQMGVGNYNISNPDSLPLKETIVQSENECVFMIISQFGLRLYTQTCANRWSSYQNGFICEKPNDGYGFVDSDNTGAVLGTVDWVFSSALCEMECLYNSKCLSFTYFTNSTCLLYAQTFSGINSDPNTVQKSRPVPACKPPAVPHNGVITLQSAQQFTYSCGLPYIVQFTDTIKCQGNGHWSDLPSCIRGDYRCPQDFEQNELVCYYVSHGDFLRTWETAVARCLTKDAVLAQVQNQAEMDFITQLLSYKASEQYWIGASDAIVNSYYTWSSSLYTEITYKNWFDGPSNDKEEFYSTDCVTVTRYFNDTDQQNAYYKDDECESYQKYICTLRLFNVGQEGCASYGEFSCKTHSSCVQDKCICDEKYIQVGADALNTTFCKYIMPIGDIGCYGMDVLCQNDSICENDVCSCPAGMSQNGPDLSYSTTCYEFDDIPCDVDWTYHNNRCLQVLMGRPTGTSVINEPFYHCGGIGAYPVVVHSAETNEVVMTLGTRRSARYIGLRWDTPDGEWSDGTGVSFITFLAVANLNSSAGSPCTVMNEVGYWQKEPCAAINGPSDVVCEKPSKCANWTEVANAMSPTGDTDVGDGGYYTCRKGYSLSGSHSGYVQCLFDGVTSFWSLLPECNAMTEELFSLAGYGNKLYGLPHSSSPATDLLECLDDCQISVTCVGVWFDDVVKACELYTDMSGTPSSSLILQDSNLDVHDIVMTKTVVCPSPVHIANANITGTSRTAGNSIVYVSEPHYRINRISPSVLTCQNNGTWDNPTPSCTSRFKRHYKEYMLGGDGMTKISRYYAVLSVEDCEQRCVIETKGRCMSSTWFYGSCTLFNKPPEQRGVSYETMHRPFDEKRAIVSVLIDSDLDSFRLFKNYDISAGTILQKENGLSREVCAQTCLRLAECTGFLYHDHSEEMSINCTLYRDTFTTTGPDTTYEEVYIRKYGCSSPPTVPNGVHSDVIRQQPGVYSIGDVLAVQCTIFGEHVIGNHNGEIKCLSTEHWSHPPVCKNLCETGWYMMNYTCYRLFDVLSGFWDAYKACHDLNAGLINMYKTQEMLLLQDLWNNTGSGSSEFWLGVYSELGSWHWTERSGGAVSNILPSLGIAAASKVAQIDLVTLAASAVDIWGPTKKYMCKKAAANLECPSGWEGYKEKCFQVKQTPATFANAENDCKASGGTLASLHTWWQKDVVTEMVSKKLGTSQEAYVGLQNEAYTIFEWMDGSVVDFMYQITHETTTLKTCGTLSFLGSAEYKFSLKECDGVTLPYVCQTYLDDIGVATDFRNLPCSTDGFCNNEKFKCIGYVISAANFPPICRHEECPAPYQYIDGGCYYYTGQKLVYAKAAAYCNSMDGYIVTMDNMKENYAVAELHLQTDTDRGTLVALGYYHYFSEELSRIDTRTKPSFTYSPSTDLRFKIMFMDFLTQLGTWRKHWIDEAVTAVIICRKAMDKPKNIKTPDPKYEGCYSDVSNAWNKDLQEMVFSDASVMTVELCVNHCYGKGFKYAGIQSGSICGCGNTRGHHSKAVESYCNVTCTGNSSQICGASLTNSVYRVSGNPCSITMVQNPSNPMMCYSMTNFATHHRYAEFDCALQGGILLELPTPDIEETVYNQLLIKHYRWGQSSSYPTVWLGLKNPDYWYSKPSVPAEWFNYKEWQSGYQSVLSVKQYDGKWLMRNGFVLFTSELSEYACQFIDTEKNLHGFDVQQAFNGTAAYQISSSGVENIINNDFSTECLKDFQRCPEGFTIKFWLLMTQLTESYIIFQTGDCASNFVGAEGFCVFYEHDLTGAINIVFKRNDSILQGAFPPTLNTQMHYLFYFQDNYNIYLYVNGVFQLQLKVFYFAPLLDMVYTDTILNTARTDLVLHHVIFTPGPPEESLLLQLQAGPEATSPESWTDFQQMSLDSWIKEELGVGIDGDGIKLASPAYALSFLESFGVANTDLEFGFWFKIPGTNGDVHQNVDILSMFDPTQTKKYFVWVIYRPSDNMLVMELNDMYGASGFKFSCEFTVPTSVWQHMAVTLHSHSLQVFHNGISVPFSTTIITGLNRSPSSTLQLGTVRCPLGFKSYGLSCYMPFLVSKDSADYPSFYDHQISCESFGGSLVALNNVEEEEYVADVLSSVNGDTQLGVFALSSATQWLSSGGRWVSYVPSYSSTNDTYNYLYFGSGIYQMLSDKITNHSICEIQHGTEKTRTEKNFFCPDGWTYWNRNCYMKGGNDTTALEALKYCAVYRSHLVEISSPEEQHLVSGIILSNSSTRAVYIGAWLDLENGNGTDYRAGNWRPLNYSHWSVSNLPTTSLSCVIADCSIDRSCPWNSVDCQSLFNPFCEKPAELHCAPGWRAFQNKCITMYSPGTFVSKTFCSQQSSRPVTFSSKVAMEEYTLQNNLGVTECLTDGVLNPDGTHSWPSLNNSATYFSGELLSGTGTCVGVTASGLILSSCSSFTCILCEYSTKNSIYLDNIHFLKSPTTNEILNKFSAEGFTEMTYVWNFDESSIPLTSLEGNRSDGKIIMLSSPTSSDISIIPDKTLGRVLHLMGQTSGLDLTLMSDDLCLKDTVNCPRGLSIEFWLYGVNMSNCILVDAKRDGTTGMIIWMNSDGNRLHASVNTMNYMWTTWIWVVPMDWIHIAVTWHRTLGLTLYTNFQKIDNQRDYVTSPVTLISVPSSTVRIGECNQDGSEVLIDDLRIRDYLMDESDFMSVEAIADKRNLKIDFNLPSENSDSNLMYNVNDSLVSYFWRNSLFHTAARIDNPNGENPAIEIPQQLFHCFTRTEICRRPFTLSLWLYPRDIESNQIFFETGTDIGMGEDVTSLKLWYNSYTDQYLFEILYDKGNYTLDFYMYLYRWWHVVLVADFSSNQVSLFVDQQQVVSISTTFQADRISPQSPFSFLRIGVVGTFDIDDIQYIPSKADPSQSYVLTSCEEYSIAGLHGIQNLTIDSNLLDNITDNQIITCDLTNEWRGYYFSFDDPNSNGSAAPPNASLDYSQGYPVYMEGVSNQAVYLKSTSVKLYDMMPLCMGNIEHCFFGLTVSMWLRIEEVLSSNEVTVVEMGGEVRLNKSGMLITCSNTSTDMFGMLECTATIINSTRKWTSVFSLQSKVWMHLTVIWNPFKSLEVYLNGHALSDFGIMAELTNVSVSDPSYNGASSIYIGAWSLSSSNRGIIAVDEGYVMDKDMTEAEIRQIFGQRHECWWKSHYYNHTEKCYTPHTDVTAQHVQAEDSCQVLGGNLAFIPDVDTYDWLLNMFTEELFTQRMWIGLKQLPRSGFPLRWSDAVQPDFNTAAVDHTGLNINVRYCGVFILSGTNWYWNRRPCSIAYRYLCENKPLYVPLQVFYLNSSNVFTNTDLNIIGEMNYTRGITQKSLTFNNTKLYWEETDTCLVNFGFCHNGLKIKFWTVVENSIVVGSKETLLTTQKNATSYGFRVYVFNDTTGLQLGVDIASATNTSSVSVPITSRAWTHVALSFSNMTDLTIYLNGIQTTLQYLVSDSDTNATKSLGEKTQVSIGSNVDNSDFMRMKLDNLTIDQVYVTDHEQLYADVYLNAPVFRLPFDNSNLISASSVNSSWLGQACLMNTSQPGPVSFTGQFSYDCLGSPDFCQEGFAFTVWIKPDGTSTDAVVVSAINQDRGFAIVYYTSYQTKTDSYWIFVRDKNTELKFPITLVSGEWSLVAFTWYLNGTSESMVNGYWMSDADAVTSSLTATGIQPVVTLEFGPLYDPFMSVVPAFEGGVDEFNFFRHPVSSEDMLNIYKNSTFSKYPSYWSFDKLASSYQGNVSTLTTNSGSLQNASHIVTGQEWLNLTSDLNETNCILDIDRCVHGFTLHLNIKFIEDEDWDQVILSTGADNSLALGIALMYTAMNKSLPFRRYFEAAVLTSTEEYRTWFNLERGVWTHITITWHKIIGIKVLVDDIFVSANETGASRTTVLNVKQELILGTYPTIGFNRGVFEVDELHFLDRATFEDTIATGEMWHHWPGKQHSSDLDIILTEVTLDECYNKCKQTEHCQDFTFCDNFRFGTCSYSNSTINTSSNDVLDCDMFVQMHIGLPVQPIGCVSTADLTKFTSMGLFPSENDCQGHCKNLTYVYSTFFLDVCYCANPNNDDVLQKRDPYYDLVCNFGDIQVWQVQGHRDFLNVTVPITEFVVDLYPGAFVLFNTSFNITMNTSAFSFSGFGIDPGNGSELFYTGYNETNLVYLSPGVYPLTIYALNEVSSMTYNTLVHVVTSIESLLLETLPITSTLMSFESNVTVIGGYIATCNISYGDNTTDSIFPVNTSLPLMVNHTYWTEGEYTVDVICYNGISSATNVSSIVAVDPIRNLTLSGLDAVVFGDSINFTASLTRGSNISAEIYLNSALLFIYLCTDYTPNITFSIPPSKYLTIGQHNITIEANNIVSGPIYESLIMTVDKEIVLALQKQILDLQFAQVGEIINATFDFLNGSNVNVTVDYGGGQTQDLFIGDVSGQLLWLLFSYETPGNYCVRFILENSVSSVIYVSSLFVDLSIVNLTLTVIEPPPVKPLGSVQFVFILPTAMMPSDAFLNIDFGDGTFLSQENMVFVDNNFTLIHNYTTIQNYDVSIIAYNSVTNISFHRTVELLKPVVNLTVTPSTLGLEVNENLNIKVDIGSGYYITYYMYISDGTENVSQSDLSVPYAQYEFNHAFTTLGKYWINIVANNSLNSEMYNFTVHVAEPTIVVFVGDIIGKVNDSLDYSLLLLAYGTQPCFLFEFGDGTEQLYGDPVCQNQNQFSGKILNPLPSNTSVLTVSHTYGVSGKFKVVMTTSSVLTYEVHTLVVRILQYPCDKPEVEIFGFSQNVSDPTEVYASNVLYMKTFANSYCIPMRNVLFDWKIESLDHAHVNKIPFTLEPLPYLVIPDSYLQYGLYEVIVLAFIEGYPEYNDTFSVFLKVVEAPLVAMLVGDQIRTVRANSPVIMNATLSYDPDLPIHNIPFNVTWYCWIGGSAFDFMTDMTSPNLKTVGSTECLHGLSPADGEDVILNIPASYLSLGSQNTFVAVMRHNERADYKTQVIHSVDDTNPDLSIRCYDNCGDTVSHNAMIRLKGICSTCTPYNRLDIPYQWKLYIIDGGTTTEVGNFQTWTTTGIDGPNVVISGGYLTPGKMYEVRFLSGDAYTYRRMYVNLPPYNGTCKSSAQRGMAFKSVFQFTCEGWLDEGFRKTRHHVIDSTQRELLKYTYSYVITQDKETSVPFLQLHGTDLTTPDVILPFGLNSFNHEVKIVIDIEDQYRGVTTVNLTLMVIPNLDNPVDILKDQEYLTCSADKDAMCMLLFDRAFTDIANGLPNQILETVVSNMHYSSSYIQDPLLLEESALLLEKLGETNMTSMTKETRDNMAEVMQDVVSMTEDDFFKELTKAERYRIAKASLLWIMKFSQKTKYNPQCSGDHCMSELKRGNFAIDIFSFVNNCSALLLEGTLPGEEPITIQLEEGNTSLKVENVEVVKMSNTSLELDGYPIATLPDLTQFLDPAITEDIFLQIFKSDNLYTTDKTVQKMKTRMISIAFLRGNIPVPIKNLHTPIEINFYMPQFSSLPFSAIDLSSKEETVPYYVEIKMNETEVTPYILLRPEDNQAIVKYYIGIDRVPTNVTHDDVGELSVANNALENSSLILHRINVHALVKNITAKTVYVGFLANYNMSKISPIVDFSVFAFDCCYWAKGRRKWSHDGLSLGPMTVSSAECLTSHLTSFGVNIFVPPNTIDFTTVFSKFSVDNMAVMSTVGAILVLYVIVLFWARRQDRTDQKKWEILPVSDNIADDTYHYHMTVYTGIRKNAGTTSNVYFVLGGEEENSEVRLLEDVEKRPLSTNSVNNYIVSMPHGLGNLQFLRLWHDTSGSGDDADWYLNMVIVRDIQTNQKYIFLCDMWLSVDKEDGQIERLLPVATDEELQAFGHLFFSQTRKDLTDGHLWISVLSRPMYSNFTRVQRLSCCLSLLFLTMITNAMWYRSDENIEHQQNVHLGPFTFSAQEFSVSLLGSLIVVPVNILIIAFFRKSQHPTRKQKNVENKYKANSNKNQKHIESRLESYLTDNWAGDFEANVVERKKNEQSAKKKKGLTLPHWCVYIAWFLVFISVVAAGFFTILYSFEWGSSKSGKWLTAFFLSFFESVILIQPLKVICVAIFFALLFKTFNDDEAENIETFRAETSKGIKYAAATYPAHRLPYTENPVKEDVVFEAREHRKKMNKLFEVLREIMVYLIYLTVVAVLAYENCDKNSFKTFSTIQNDFVLPPSTKHKSFINLASVDSFWQWTHEYVIPNLYSYGFYNGNTTADLNGFLADNIHYRMGPPRLRQARVTTDVSKCTVAPQVHDVITVCEPDYSIGTYDNQHYYPGWQTSGNNSDTAWQYQDTMVLDGLPMVGRYSSYGGGGYVAELGHTAEAAHNFTEYLHSMSWIDKYTRAVIVEFNLYNPNVNLFTVVALMAEFPTSGGVFPWPQINPLVMYRYNGASAIFVLVFDIIFVIFTIVYTYDIYKRIRSQRKEFLFAIWNWVDFLNICMSITLCALYGVHFLEARFTLEKFRNNKAAYVNLNHLLMWDKIYHYVLSFLLFTSMLKLLQLIRFNTKITQLSSTLTRARGPILSFFVVFGFVFMAFSSSGYMIFGRADSQYKSFFDTIETLTSMLMMKINIHTMLQVNGTLGYFYLFLFVLFIVFILINMLLSILNEAFTEVKQDPALRAEDPKVVDFVMEQIKQFLFPKRSNRQVSAKTEKQPFDNLEQKISVIDRRISTIIRHAYDDAM